MVGLATLHFAFRRQLDCVSVLAQDVIARVVHVVGGIRDVVDGTDGDGQLRIRTGDLGEVDGIVRVGTVDAGATQEEAENVVVLAVDPCQVLIRAEHVVEADGVSCRHEVKFDGTDVVDAADAETLADEGRHTVGDGEQVVVTGYLEVVVDEFIPASVVHVGRVVGHLGGQNEAGLNRELSRIEARDFSNLHGTSGEHHVRGFHSGSEEHVVDVLLRREGAVHFDLGRQEAHGTNDQAEGHACRCNAVVQGQGHGCRNLPEIGRRKRRKVAPSALIIVNGCGNEGLSAPRTPPTLPSTACGRGRCGSSPSPSGCPTPRQFHRSGIRRGTW